MRKQIRFRSLYDRTAILPNRSDKNHNEERSIPMRRTTALILAVTAFAVLGVTSAFAATKSVSWNFNSGGAYSISKNTTVKWTWGGTGAHNVVIKKGSSQIKTSGGVKTSGTYNYKFTSAGTYTAYCAPHINAGMKQTITVR